MSTYPGTFHPIEDQKPSVPLIWTKYGNLPVSRLRYVPRWTETETCVQLVEEYFLGDELVRNNVHNYMRTPNA